MNLDNNQRVFFELLKAGLWENGCNSFNSNLNADENIDWGKVFLFAQEQSVQGLVVQGVEELRAKNFGLKVPQGQLLQWIGEVQMIEQKNLAMNDFVARLIDYLRKKDVYLILIKGQGIAQCYNKPLWRSCGDVDLFLSKENYDKAKEYLNPLASAVEKEDEINRHLGMTIDGWPVELHGTLRGGIKSIDRVIDDVQKDVFHSGNVRSWMCCQTQVFLPRADENVFFVFTHILQHFYMEGIGLRQICDWCRLLWTYKESLNHGLLESRLRKAGIMTEWKAFGTFAVEYLGMPMDVMPLLDVRDKISVRLKMKANKILEFVLESGNFGHNRDISYKQKYPFIVRYAMSFRLYTKLAIQRFQIFPRNALLAWWAIVKLGTNAAVKAM